MDCFYFYWAGIALFSGKDPKKQFEEALASMKKKVK